MATLSGALGSMHLVFVHIPKTAGTSLLASVQERVGRQNLRPVFDMPLAKSGLRRNAAAIVSAVRANPLAKQIYLGHFIAGKYARFNGWSFVPREGCCYATMLREPLQRALSHYYCWKRTPAPGHEVWERFTREQWSLERFLLADEITNLQSKFLWRFPLRRFHVVGLAERYQESVAMLGRAFAPLNSLPSASANVNPDRQAGKGYEVDAALAAEFKQRNRQDYELYDEGVALFESRLAGADTQTTAARFMESVESL